MPIRSERQRNELHKTTWSIAVDLLGTVVGFGTIVADLEDNTR